MRETEQEINLESFRYSTFKAKQMRKDLQRMPLCPQRPQQVERSSFVFLSRVCYPVDRSPSPQHTFVTCAHIFILQKKKTDTGITDSFISKVPLCKDLFPVRVTVIDVVLWVLAPTCCWSGQSWSFSVTLGGTRQTCGLIQNRLQFFWTLLLLLVQKPDYFWFQSLCLDLPCGSNSRDIDGSM